MWIQHRQCRDKPIVETTRADAVGELPQLADRGPELCDRLVEKLPVHINGAASKMPLRDPQRHPERDEPQLGAVVQIAFESLPFLVARAKYA